MEAYKLQWFYPNYYINKRDEFYSETGHEKLLIGLKKHISTLTTDKNILAIDVGSCVGEYIKNLKEICSEASAKLILFEPNPINIEALVPKINDTSNIQLYKHCVSDINTTADFFNYKHNPTNISGNGIAGLRSGGEKICTTEVRRIDTVLNKHYDPSNTIIKFIKIDTEGNDTNVIKGLGDYLYNTKYIIFECSDCLDDQRGPGIKEPMKDIVQYLSSYGFNTYRIGTRKMLKVNDEYWNEIFENVKFWSNCFAIKKDDPLIHKLIDEDFNYLF